MPNNSDQAAVTKASLSDRIHFRVMSLVHEDFYGLFKDPYKTLKAAGLSQGQKVLEVGCGPGFFAVPAARIVGANGQVLALDINPLATSRVQVKVVDAGVTNVKIIPVDAADTGLPNQSFDLIFMFGLELDHALGNMQTIMAEMHRLLKPDGILAVEGRLEPSSERFSPAQSQGRIARFKKVP